MKIKKQKQKETKLLILTGGRGTRLTELEWVIQTIEFQNLKVLFVVAT